MNFDGPVRVVDAAGEGTATVTLSFDAWKGAKVTPTTHSIQVLPPKAGPKSEPVAPNLVASLIHPERKASVWTIQFSPDGSRLFTAGYPSGIVQVWDVTSRKEVRRIDTPPGYRGSANYALLTPDWKTLYVPVEKRTVKPFERDGKKLYRIEYAGKIRVWDVASGKEKEPVRAAEGSAPLTADLSADGRLLFSIERPSHDSTERPTDVTVVWDLGTGKKRKLCDGYARPQFLSGGKTVAVSVNDYEASTSVVKLLDVVTGKELAVAKCPEKGRRLQVSAVSPDGALVAVGVGGTKGAPLEVWFLDGKTLETRGKLVGKGDPKRFGWGHSRFTPDSRKFIAFDGEGNALVWDVAGKKLERTIPTGGGQAVWLSAISPDGRTLAVGWMPKLDAELENELEPDPADLPQARVSLIDLTGKNSPRVLIAPHGYASGLAFSPDGKTLAFGGSGAVRLFDLTK